MSSQEKLVARRVADVEFGELKNQVKNNTDAIERLEKSVSTLTAAVNEVLFPLRFLKSTAVTLGKFTAWVAAVGGVFAGAWASVRAALGWLNPHQ